MCLKLRPRNEISLFFNWDCYVAYVNCIGDRKGGTDRKSMKYRPPAFQGGEDYMVNWLYIVDQEMKKLFNEDR